MKVELQCGDTITIPDGCKATIKDGSVVFEKEEKKEQEFKDGDVLVDDFKTPLFPFKIIMVYKGTKSGEGCYECYIHRDAMGDIVRDGDCCNSHFSKIRHATEEEKQLLFDKMKEKGLQWNAEEKRVEKIRWRAKRKEDYHFINTDLTTVKTTESGDDTDASRHNAFNYFRTKEYTAEAARRVRETLRKYHEEIGE